MENNVVFRLTIEDWSDHVDCFLRDYNITNEVKK